MDPTLIAIIVLVLGLALGYFLGHRFGSAPVKDWQARHGERDTEAKELDAKFRKAIVDLENATVRAERADEIAAKFEEVRSEREGLANKLASLESSVSARETALEERYAEREAQFERELKRLQDAEEKLQAKFSEIGEKLLQGAGTKFLEGAQSHLANLNRESLAELEKKVGPVGETLERYRKRVEELEKNRVTDFERLQGVIGQVREGQQRVIDGANRITNTLQGATKARGDWGELQLANLLESCGLYDKADFDFQTSVRDEGGNLLRPDAVLNIPGSRRLVVDVKNVFNTYRAANEAESDEARQTLLRTHARELRIIGVVGMG